MTTYERSVAVLDFFEKKNDIEIGIGKKNLRTPAKVSINGEQYDVGKLIKYSSTYDFFYHTALVNILLN